MGGIDRILAGVHREIADMKRRTASIVREGKVVEVQGDRMKVELGDETASLVTPWIRWAEIGGAARTWSPPSIGEMRTVFSPSGEIGEHSIGLPGGFTDENAAPSDNLSANILTRGDVTIKVTDSSIEIAIGAATFTLSSAGFVQVGGQQRHDGKDVGATHTHTDTPGSGAGITSPPN